MKKIIILLFCMMLFSCWQPEKVIEYKIVEKEVIPETRETRFEKNVTSYSPASYLKEYIQDSRDYAINFSISAVYELRPLFEKLLIVKAIQDEYNLTRSEIQEYFEEDISQFYPYVDDYTFEELEDFRYKIMSKVEHAYLETPRPRVEITKHDIKWFFIAVKFEPHLISVYVMNTWLDNVYDFIDSQENKKYFVSQLKDSLQYFTEDYVTEKDIQDFLSTVE